MLKFAFHRIVTEALFALIAILTLVSIGLVVNGGIRFTFVAVLVFGLNVWAVAKSDAGGFFRGRRLPRSGAADRAFHPVQTALLVILMVIQVAFISYAVLAFDPQGIGGQPDSGISQPSPF